MVLFTPEFGLVFWMLVVFLTILAILGKYAWPVIIRSIEQRAEFIDNGVKFTEQAILQLDEAKVKVQGMFEEVHKRQMESLRETERMKRGMIEEAKKSASIEAQKIITEAKVSIEQAKREAEQQVAKQVSRLSLDIAGKVLRKNLSEDPVQIELINKLLSEIK